MVDTKIQPCNKAFTYAMRDRTPEQIATECEGLEIIDEHDASVVSVEIDLEDAYREVTDCKRYVRHARLKYYRAWVQNLRHGIAQQLSVLVREVPLWPIAVVYILASAFGLLILRISLQAMPFMSDYLISIVTGTALALGIIALVFGVVVVCDSRKDAGTVTTCADNSMARLEEVRLMCLDSRSRLRGARQIVAALEQQRKTQSQAGQVASDSSISKLLTVRRRFAKIFWRSLTGERWEKFLADVFEAHGYSVELTKVSGDQGVDLIVQYSRVRLAVQAKGYSGSVGNAAVQEAVAGRIFYNCTHCAVITNSTFTKSARELASRTSCVLIGESEIDDLISGGLKRYF
jgi:hypothetical protein